MMGIQKMEMVVPKIAKYRNLYVGMAYCKVNNNVMMVIRKMGTDVHQTVENKRNQW